MRHRFQIGFTLIELLIVVAIIAILAAIAVPNFLEAQVRAKVSRIKSDQRSVATALESYRVDNPRYPTDSLGVVFGGQRWVHPVTGYDTYFVQWALIPLTTPIAYMTSLPGTSFNTVGSQHDAGLTFKYDGKNHGSEWSTCDYPNGQFWYFTKPAVGWTTEVKWRLRDVGPDLWQNNQSDGMPYAQWLYDSTNGTMSTGDIVRWGP